MTSRDISAYIFLAGTFLIILAAIGGCTKEGEPNQAFRVYSGYHDYQAFVERNQ